MPIAVPVPAARRNRCDGRRGRIGAGEEGDGEEGGRWRTSRAAKTPLPTRAPVVAPRVRQCTVRMVCERGWSSAYAAWGKKRDITVMFLDVENSKCLTGVVPVLSLSGAGRE